jgi:hypothetical protein
MEHPEEKGIVQREQPVPAMDWRQDIRHIFLEMTDAIDHHVTPSGNKFPLWQVKRLFAHCHSFRSCGHVCDK